MHHEEILVQAAADSHSLYHVADRPAGLSVPEFGIIKEFYLHRWLECSLEFAERYDLNGTAKRTKWGFDEHLLVLYTYLNDHPRSDQELAWLVQQWSSRIDKNLNVAPSTDFVRLMVLAHKKDKPGFLKLLEELRTRWPDPKHPQWLFAREIIVETMSDQSWDSSSFQSWYNRQFVNDQEGKK